jgi:hypothetical protein
MPSLLLQTPRWVMIVDDYKTLLHQREYRDPILYMAAFCSWFVNKHASLYCESQTSLASHVISKLPPISSISPECNMSLHPYIGEPDSVWFNSTHLRNGASIVHQENTILSFELNTGMVFNTSNQLSDNTNADPIPTFKPGSFQFQLLQNLVSAFCRSGPCRFTNLVVPRIPSHSRLFNHHEDHLATISSVTIANHISTRSIYFMLRRTVHARLTTWESPPKPSVDAETILDLHLQKKLRYYSSPATTSLSHSSLMYMRVWPVAYSCIRSALQRESISAQSLLFFLILALTPLGSVDRYQSHQTGHAVDQASLQVTLVEAIFHELVIQGDLCCRACAVLTVICKTFVTP